MKADIFLRNQSVPSADWQLANLNGLVSVAFLQYVEQIICRGLAHPLRDHLAQGLLSKDRIEIVVIVDDLAEFIYIGLVGVHHLLDARRIEHGLVLERGQTVVKHIVGDMQPAGFHVNALQLVVGELCLGIHLLTVRDILQQRRLNLLHHVM